MQTPLHEFYRDDSFVVKVQVEGEVIILHLTCTEWNKTVLKRMYNVFASLLEQARKAGIKTMTTITPNPKFSELFGGVRVGSYEDMEIMIWKV